MARSRKEVKERRGRKKEKAGKERVRVKYDSGDNVERWLEQVVDDSSEEEEKKNNGGELEKRGEENEMK